MSPRKQPQTGTQPIDGYRPVIEFLSKQPQFSIQEVNRQLGSDAAKWITLSVNELVQQGWILPKENAEDIFFWNEARENFSAELWLDQKRQGNRIKSSPKAERPRERLLKFGAESLGVSELIAILIRSGRPGESAVVAGQKIARQYEHRLESLANAGRGELKSISCAVAEAAYCQIMAGIELGRRINERTKQAVPTRIASTAEAIAYCRVHFLRLATDRRQEEFHIITLDTKNQIIDTHRITVGTLDASLVHPREVFRPAIKDAAASVILVHNHPSGDAAPSPQDYSVTKRLDAAGQMLGIEVLDHIVLGKSTAISIRES